MCVKPKIFADNLDRTESFVPYDVDYDSCDYVDSDESIPISSGYLVVMQLNIRGLYSKLDKLKTLLDEYTSGKKADVILLCETWQSKTSPLPKLGHSCIQNTANINLVAALEYLSLID